MQYAYKGCYTGERTNCFDTILLSFLKLDSTRLMARETKTDAHGWYRGCLVIASTTETINVEAWRG